MTYKKNKKILFIGNLIISKFILDTLYKNKAITITGILTTRNNYNSDYYNLIPYAKFKNIPILSTKKINSLSAFNWIVKQKPDWIIVVGLSYLLKGKILNKFKNRIIGYHPSDLPFNKGRHPLIWSVFLKLKKIGSSFFLINKKIDNGDIISKKYFINNSNLKMKHIYMKMIRVSQSQIKDIVDFINLKRKIKLRKEKRGNLWRKRSKEDGKIDWRMGSDSICNLVNALSWPYDGATFNYKNKNFKISSIKQVSNKNFSKENNEPGKIIDVKNYYYPLVKTYDGVIKIVKYKPLFKFKINDYLI
jgi:methionyl-tRNA formyltransferase